MNYYMMESVESDMEDFADVDFNLLFSFDHDDDKGLHFFNEFEASMTSSDNEMYGQMVSAPVKVESNKKRCNKRKRDIVESTPSQDETSSQCSSIISKKRKIINSSSTAPLDYANKFIKILNCGDMMEMQQSLQSMCSEKVKVTKHYYLSNEELRAQEDFSRLHPEVKQEEFLSTMQFQNMTDFLHYLKMINYIIPDGAFAIDIDNTRCCSEGKKGSVYMASFSFSGTSLCAHMNLLSNKMSLLDYNEETIMNVLNQACRQKSFQHYTTEGSIALYVNEEGMIKEIEFFETRCIFN